MAAEGLSGWRKGIERNHRVGVFYAGDLMKMFIYKYARVLLAIEVDDGEQVICP